MQGSGCQIVLGAGYGPVKGILPPSPPMWARIPLPWTWTRMGTTREVVSALPRHPGRGGGVVLPLSSKVGWCMYTSTLTPTLNKRSWECDIFFNFATTAMRQRNTGSGTRQFFKMASVPPGGHSGALLRMMRWTLLMQSATELRHRHQGPMRTGDDQQTKSKSWSSHNDYSNNAKTNNFVAWKHGHVVAAVLSCAQLCK